MTRRRGWLGAAIAAWILAGHAAAQAVSYEELVAEAEALRSERKLQAAFASASRACELVPGRFEGFLLAALVLYEKGAEAEARAYFARARELAPKDKQQGLAALGAMLDADSSARQAAQHLASGREARGNGLYAKAAEQLLLAHRLQPHDVEIATEAVAALSQREMWFELAQVVRAVAATPDAKAREAAAALATNLAPVLERERDLSLAAAEAHLDQLDWAAAAAELERTVTFAPDAGEAHYQLGVCRTRLGDLDGAVAALRAALAAGHYVVEDFVGAFELNSLLAREDFVQLLADAFGREAKDRAVAGRLPPEAECLQLVEIARVLEQRSDFVRASARLRDGLRLRPEDPYLTFELARASAVAGKTDDVPALLDQALARGFADAQRWFATRQLEPFVFDEARADRAVEAWRGRDVPYEELSDGLLKAGRADAAFAVLGYADKVSPGRASVAMRGARAAAAVGRRDTALAQLALAAQRGFDDLDFVLKCPQFALLRDDENYKRALLTIARNKESR